jgi:hypothetical protein
VRRAQLAARSAIWTRLIASNPDSCVAAVIRRGDGIARRSHTLNRTAASSMRRSITRLEYEGAS